MTTLDHMILRVRNPAASIRFYQQVLGFKRDTYVSVCGGWELTVGLADARRNAAITRPALRSFGGSRLAGPIKRQT
jgi:catechol 2,3-dioxygenase-like lactoylglutathione lyase family enzyme